jgi:hypothetical protein
MHDLIGAYQRLDRIYQLYIKSAFPLRYQNKWGTTKLFK